MSDSRNAAVLTYQLEKVWSAIDDIRARIIAPEKAAAPAPETDRQSAPDDALRVAYERGRKDGRHEGRKGALREMLAWCENEYTLNPAINRFRDRILRLFAVAEGNAKITVETYPAGTRISWPSMHRLRPVTCTGTIVSEAPRARVDGVYTVRHDQTGGVALVAHGLASKLPDDDALLDSGGRPWIRRDGRAETRPEAGARPSEPCAKPFPTIADWRADADAADCRESSV